MRKLLNKPWFVAVLALAALGLVGSSLLTRQAPAPREAAVAVASEEAIPAELLLLSPTDALAALPSTPDARNPFAPRQRVESAAEKSAPPDLIDQLHLSAIWTQDRITYVLINNRILGAGEEVGRVTIESATQEGVWLSHWKGRDFLSLGGDFTLKTPASGTL